MKTIFLNNKIQLIENFTNIQVVVICPKRNIQNMLKATKGKLISKKETRLNFNNHAGQVFEVTILARFENVEKYLKKQDLYNYNNAENYAAYMDLISVNSFGFGGFAMVTKLCYENVIVGLYAFGDCSRLSGNGNTYTRYYNANGHSILRCDNDFTNGGVKRYIKTGKGWLSNKNY